MSGLKSRLDALVEEALAEGCAGELRDLFDEARPRLLALRGPAAAIDVPMRCGMIGDSPVMQGVFDLIERVANSDVSVVIRGETGTGKELVARALHELSPRSAKPFVAENCAAVPASLLESELFGHKRGSFTGAVSDRAGRFEAADGGTLFLDEVGDMPREMQAKLLRALETREVRPVGSNHGVRVDVRLVTATNCDLERMVADRSFREDLLFRLNVVRIDLPPLRERNGDIEHLVRYFLHRSAEESDSPMPEISPEAMQALREWSWPGNVRQLENELLRDVALTSGKIGVADLSPEIVAGSGA